MNTRDNDNTNIARNGFFEPRQARDNVYAYTNPAYTAEECALIEDICKRLSDITVKPEVEIFICGLLDKGGLKYLDCAQQHLDNNVLARVGQMYLMARHHEDRQPGKWQEHIKVVRSEYTTLTTNLAILKALLKQHQQSNDNVHQVSTFRMN